MKKTHAVLLALAATAALAAPARAQLPNFTPFSFEARGGLSLPLGEMKSDGDAKVGTTVGASVTYHALPLIGVYGGYSRSEFGVGDDELEDGKYTDSGFAAGVRVGIPTPLIPIDPWARAGLVFHRLQASVGDEEVFESDSGTGFEVGAGLGFGLGPKVSVTPGVTYTAYRYEADGGPDDEVEVNHLRLDLGLRIRL